MWEIPLVWVSLEIAKLRIYQFYNQLVNTALIVARIFTSELSPSKEAVHIFYTDLIFSAGHYHMLVTIYNSVYTGELEDSTESTILPGQSVECGM